MNPDTESMARDAMDLLHTGGPVVLILLVLSVLALAIVFAKLIQFRAARIGERGTAHEALRLWKANRAGEEIALAGRARGPLAQAIARAMRAHGTGRGV